MLALVDKRLLHVIGGIELGGLLRWVLGGRLGIVARENAAIFGLDSPKATLMVHLGP